MLGSWATDNADVIVISLASDSGTNVGNDRIFTFGGNDTVTLMNDDDSADLGAGNAR